MDLVSGLLNGILIPLLPSSTEQTTITEVPPSIGSDVVVIFDDVDLCPFDQLKSIYKLQARATPNADGPMTFFVTRMLTDTARTWITTLGKTRVLPSERLAINEGEIEELIKAGTFGSVPASGVKKTWQLMGGWFAGMLRILNPEVIRSSTLDEYVYAEIVLPQPRSVQNMIFALSKFPYISSDLFAYLLHRQGGDVEHAATLLSQLPLHNDTHSPDDQPASLIPAPLQSCLERLANKHGSLGPIRSLYRFGIDWFILHEDYMAARALAVTSGRSNYYLEAIHGHCVALAMQDRWCAIHDLVRDVPESILLEHNDFAMWTLIAEAYAGNWTNVSRLQRVMIETWRNAHDHSEDPIRHGRALQLQADVAWANSADADAYTFASASFQALPEDALQDRLFASVTAEVAARQLGNASAIEHWSTVSNNYRKMLSMGPEWWHINCGFSRSSHVARSGNINLAHSQAVLGLEHVDPDFPRASFWFLLLMVYIDIERGMYDAAWETLTRTQKCINGALPQDIFNMAMAQYHLVTGEPDSARSLLGVAGNTIHNRADHNSHRLRLLAQAEMADGNLDLAYDILTHWTHGEDTWPKYFGEPHHYILKATLQVLRGDIAAALALTTHVITESNKRGHLCYAMAAYAIQAECYQRQGKIPQRDQALDHLAELDPQGSFVRSSSPFGRDVRLLKGAQPPTTSPLPMNQRLALTRLSAREKEILAAAARGLNTRQIAEEFFLSQSTVKNHMPSINKKLGVRSRREAVLITYPLRRK